jgi:hypothetical protein
MPIFNEKSADKRMREYKGTTRSAMNGSFDDWPRAYETLVPRARWQRQDDPQAVSLFAGIINAIGI